jgi:hypothetical protein
MMIFQQIEPLNQWNKNEKHYIIMDECLHVPCIMAECLRVPCVMFRKYVETYAHNRSMFTRSVCNVSQIRGNICT